MLVQSETKFQRNSTSCEVQVMASWLLFLKPHVPDHFVVIKNFWTSALCFVFCLTVHLLVSVKFKCCLFTHKWEAAVSSLKEITITWNLLGTNMEIGPTKPFWRQHEAYKCFLQTAGGVTVRGEGGKDPDPGAWFPHLAGRRRAQILHPSLQPGISSQTEWVVINLFLPLGLQQGPCLLTPLTQSLSCLQQGITSKKPHPPPDSSSAAFCRVK